MNMKNRDVYMNEKTIHKSKSFEAISNAFDSSLQNLGIEITRFRAMPLEQRKLAFREAIIKIAGPKINEIDWLEDRSELHDKELWDFSPEQILNHQIIVNALIALVCLGEATYVRPLITYLSFPEKRWSILIEPVLKAVLKKSIQGPIYRLPNKSNLSKWHIWALNQSYEPYLEDYSMILLTKLGEEKVKWYHYQSNETSDSSWLVSKDEFKNSKWMYFNDYDANYCALRLYPELESNNFYKFIINLDEHIKEHPFERNYDTLVSCIRDKMSESNLSNRKLKRCYLKAVQEKNISPLTIAITFRVFPSSTKNRRLANQVAKKMAGTDSDRLIISIVSDLLTKSVNDKAVYRLVNFCSNIDEMSEMKKNLVFDLNPLISRHLNHWLSNLFFNESESLCLLGSEDQHNREDLFELLKDQFKKNDKSLLKLTQFQKSSDDKCQWLGNKFEELYDLRQNFEYIYEKENEINLKLFIPEYKKVLNDWSEDMTNLQTSQNDKQISDTRKQLNSQSTQ